MRYRINSRNASKYVFLLPGFLVFAFAMLIPFFMGINIAFTDWNGITRDYNYVGFENFIRAFSDSRLRQPVDGAQSFDRIWAAELVQSLCQNGIFRSGLRQRRFDCVSGKVHIRKCV